MLAAVLDRRIENGLHPSGISRSLGQPWFPHAGGKLVAMRAAWGHVAPLSTGAGRGCRRLSVEKGMPPTQCQGLGLSQYGRRLRGFRAVLSWRAVLLSAGRCVELGASAEPLALSSAVRALVVQGLLSGAGRWPIDGQCPDDQVLVWLLIAALIAVELVPVGLACKW